MAAAVGIPSSEMVVGGGGGRGGEGGGGGAAYLEVGVAFPSVHGGLDVLELGDNLVGLHLLRAALLQLCALVLGLDALASHRLPNRAGGIPAGLLQNNQPKNAVQQKSTR